MLFESMLAIAAVLLIGSGGFKLVDRAPTRGALAAARLPAGEAAVVALALVEIGAGTASLAVRHPAAPLALGAVYLAFAVFVGVGIVMGFPIQSCGCFGKADTPPTRIHVAVNLAFAASAVGAVSAPRLLDRAIETPGAALVFVALASTGAYLTYLLLAELPATLGAMEHGA